MPLASRRIFQPSDLSNTDWESARLKAQADSERIERLIQERALSQQFERLRQDLNDRLDESRQTPGNKDQAVSVTIFRCPSCSAPLPPVDSDNVTCLYCKSQLHIKGITNQIANSGVVDEDTEAEDQNQLADPLFEKAKQVVVYTQQGSVSIIQRRLRVGYSRAASLIDMLEQAGVVGPFQGSKTRDVLIKSYDGPVDIDELRGAEHLRRLQPAERCHDSRPHPQRGAKTRKKRKSKGWSIFKRRSSSKDAEPGLSNAWSRHPPADR